jgi:hypothetical protein
MEDENKTENAENTAEKFEQEEQPETDGSEGFVSDPSLYEKLSVPYESIAVATAKGNEFYQEVCALREKYNVPEFVIAFEVNAKAHDIFGRERPLAVLQVGFRGSPPGANRLIMHLVKKTRFGSLLIRAMEEFSLTILGL